MTPRELQHVLDTGPIQYPVFKVINISHKSAGYGINIGDVVVMPNPVKNIQVYHYRAGMLYMPPQDLEFSHYDTV